MENREPHYQEKVSKNITDDGIKKQWINDELFKEAIKKSLEAGIIKIGTPAGQVMALLRKKYMVAKKYADMIDNEIRINIF